jgi:hypothetical protein
MAVYYDAGRETDYPIPVNDERAREPETPPTVAQGASANPKASRAGPLNPGIANAPSHASPWTNLDQERSSTEFGKGTGKGKGKEVSPQRHHGTDAMLPGPDSPPNWAADGTANGQNLGGNSASMTQEHIQFAQQMDRLNRMFQIYQRQYQDHFAQGDLDNASKVKEQAVMVQQKMGQMKAAMAQRQQMGDNAGSPGMNIQQTTSVSVAPQTRGGLSSAPLHNTAAVIPSRPPIAQPNRPETDQEATYTPLGLTAHPSWQEQAHTSQGHRQDTQPALSRGNANLAVQTESLPPRPRSTSPVTPIIRVSTGHPYDVVRNGK